VFRAASIKRCDRTADWTTTGSGTDPGSTGTASGRAGNSRWCSVLTRRQIKSADSPAACIPRVYDPPQVGSNSTRACSVASCGCGGVKGILQEVLVSSKRSKQTGSEIVTRLAPWKSDAPTAPLDQSGMTGLITIYRADSVISSQDLSAAILSRKTFKG
jgi:hypothetical protein